MYLEQLINRKHQQLNHIKARLFNCMLTREVEFYSPEVADNSYVLKDEEDFEEADITGSLNVERMPLSYIHQGILNVIEVQLTVDGRLSVVRNNELNEFQQDKIFYYMTQDTPIPMQSVIQYQTITSLDGSTTQTIRLVKVDEQIMGKPSYVNQLHCFKRFHGEIS